MVDASEAHAGGAAAERYRSTAAEPEGGAAVRLPVPPETGRRLVFAAVFLCAACGLVYELELIALAGSLAGDTVTHTSVVLSLMVFAMGIGSLGVKRLRGRASYAFGLIEALLALTGGFSAAVLYLSFLWAGEARPVLIAFSLTTGMLIGAEMPLLMALIQRIRRQDAGGAVADLSAADYVGALLGGLAFPFLLLPLLGELYTALFTGVVNALAGGAVVLWLFRRDLTAGEWRRLFAVNTAVIGLLLASGLLAGPLEHAVGKQLEERAQEQAREQPTAEEQKSAGGPGNGTRTAPRTAAPVVRSRTGDLAVCPGPRPPDVPRVTS